MSLGETPMYPLEGAYQEQVYANCVPAQQQMEQPDFPQAQESSSNPPGESTNREEREEDEKSVEGEPGYIPDKALNLDFDACFHEHESTKTLKQVYQVLGIIYKYSKLVIYHILVILIGIPMAILWANLNGIFVFIHVWLYQPVMKITIFWVYAFAPLVTIPLQAVFTPLVDVSARIFRQIRIKATLNGSIGDKLAGHSHKV